jgi:hypothetical protein
MADLILYESWPFIFFTKMTTYETKRATLFLVGELPPKGVCTLALAKMIAML